MHTLNSGFWNQGCSSTHSGGGQTCDSDDAQRGKLKVTEIPFFGYVGYVGYISIRPLHKPLRSDRLTFEKSETLASRIDLRTRIETCSLALALALRPR